MNRKNQRQPGSASRSYDAHPKQSAAIAGEGGSSSAERARDAGMETLTLAELIDAADVTVRTVRYYIAEGLLPPPIGSGPGSAYGRGHLDRLRLIQRLKEAYLPLKEIRRRLAGLDDDEVRAILAGVDAEAATSLHETVADASLARARDYLAMMDSRERYRTEPMALMMPAAPVPVQSRSRTAGRDLVPEASLDWNESDLTEEPAPPMNRAASPEPRREEAVESGEGLWRRIPLGDEAELVISDRVYIRHRERIDWLVRWARKVLA